MKKLVTIAKTFIQAVNNHWKGEPTRDLRFVIVCALGAFVGFISSMILNTIGLTNLGGLSRNLACASAILILIVIFYDPVKDMWNNRKHTPASE